MHSTNKLRTVSEGENLIIRTYLFVRGYVRCVNKYNILKHELTTAMQYRISSLRRV